MKRLALVLAFLFIPFSSYAEPTDAIKFLMNEPYTLFDKGLDELGDFMEKEVCDKITEASDKTDCLSRVIR